MKRMRRRLRLENTYADWAWTLLRPKEIRPPRAEKGNVPIQEAARELRYEFLGSVCRRLGAQRVAVGHTRDDQVEEILLRLCRGTGPDGLSGMPVMRAPFIRPLLGSSRPQILEYPEHRGGSVHRRPFQSESAFSQKPDSLGVASGPGSAFSRDSGPFDESLRTVSKRLGISGRSSRTGMEKNTPVYRGGFDRTGPGIFRAFAFVVGESGRA